MGRIFVSSPVLRVSGTDTDVLAWRTQVIANGGSVSAGRMATVNTLVGSLKGGGIWSKLDRLWILATESTVAALTDIKGLTLAVANGSPTFQVDRGYTGVDASTTVYINSSTNFSTLGGQFSTNSCHLSVWSNTATAAGATGGVMAGMSSGGGSNNTGIVPRDNTDSVLFRINDGSPSSGFANVSGTGHYISSRTGASSSSGYKNGTLVGSPNAAAGTIPNINADLLALNDTISGHFFGSGAQCCMVSFGGGLSTGDVTSFYNALRAYMTAVGVP